MPSVNFLQDYASPFHSNGNSTIIRIGNSDTRSVIDMPAQIDPSYPSDWGSRSSRPTSRADSAGSNVSLKDTVDVFVDDKFHKSYNLNYEPVRIKIGDEDGQAGRTYSSRPLQDSSNIPSLFDHGRTSGNAVRSSYHKNVKESYSATTPTGQNSSSIISVGGQNDFLRTKPAYSQDHFNDSALSQERIYHVPVRVESGYSYSPKSSSQGRSVSQNTSRTASRKEEYSIPITQNNAPHAPSNTRSGVSIPVTGGRSDHVGVFSPDSGRESMDLPISRAGYAPTPLPATPLGRQSDITFSPNGSQISIGGMPYPNGTSKSGYQNPSTSDHLQSHGKEYPYDSGRPTVHFDASSNSAKDQKRDNSATFTRDSGYGKLGNQNTQTYVRTSNNDHDRSDTHTHVRDSGNDDLGYRSTQTYARDSDYSDQENRPSSIRHSSRTRPDYDHYAALPSRNEAAQNFGVSKINVSHDNQAIVNSPSLTYAVDSRPSTSMSDHYEKSAIPNASPENMRSSSLNRSSSRGRDRPSSRVGLPTYERDYVDKPGDESDLDNLSDDERNERLQQKKLIYPQSRNAALVAELKETTNNISATRRSRKEQEFSRRVEKKEFSSMLDRLTAEQFMPQVPYYDEEGLPIAEYKRSFLAKQAANQARREFQARIEDGEEIENIVASPEWKRLFIDSAKEEYDGTPFGPGVGKDLLHTAAPKPKTGNKLQPWQLELKRLERYHD